MTPQQELRRQVERICLDLYLDEETLIRTGTFVQMPVADFARTHGWRQHSVKDALRDLERAGLLRGLNLAPGSASFHLVLPAAFRHLEP